jgi:hypothetical protein
MPNPDLQSNVLTPDERIAAQVTQADIRARQAKLAGEIQTALAQAEADVTKTQGTALQKGLKDRAAAAAQAQADAEGGGPTPNEVLTENLQGLDNRVDLSQGPTPAGQGQPVPGVTPGGPQPAAPAQVLNQVQQNLEGIPQISDQRLQDTAENLQFRVPLKGRVGEAASLLRLVGIPVPQPKVSATQAERVQFLQESRRNALEVENLKARTATNRALQRRAELGVVEDVRAIVNDFVIPQSMKTNARGDQAIKSQAAQRLSTLAGIGTPDAQREMATIANQFGSKKGIEMDLKLAADRQKLIGLQQEARTAQIAGPVNRRNLFRAQNLQKLDIFPGETLRGNELTVALGSLGSAEGLAQLAPADMGRIVNSVYASTAGTNALGGNVVFMGDPPEDIGDLTGTVGGGFCSQGKGFYTVNTGFTSSLMRVIDDQSLPDTVRQDAARLYSKTTQGAIQFKADRSQGALQFRARPSILEGGQGQMNATAMSLLLKVDAQRSAVTTPEDQPVFDAIVDNLGRREQARRTREAREATPTRFDALVDRARGAIFGDS